MTTLRNTNLSANTQTQLASKSLKGCKVLAGLGELSLLHAFTHIVMNEGTLRIPDRTQFQPQSDKSTRPSLLNVKPTKVTQLVFHKSCTQGREKLQDWSSQLEVANKQNWRLNVRKNKTSWTGAKKNFWYRHWKLSPHAFFPRPVELCPLISKHHLQCAEQPESPSNVTRYCACHKKWLSWLIIVTYKTSYTIRRAEQQDSPPKSPNIAPATKNDSHDWYNRKYIKSYLQCAEQQESPSNITIYCKIWICWKRLKRDVKCAADPSMIREWPDRETVSPQPAAHGGVTFRARNVFQGTIAPMVYFEFN